MGVLDGGLQSVFGVAFGSFYLDGVLQEVTNVPVGGGSTEEVTTDHAIKVQKDRATQRMREAEGYSSTDVAFYILQAGLSVDPNTDHRVIFQGQIWAIANIEADPASTYWEARGSFEGEVQET